MQFYKKLLTIAGSDSGGGAGIQADLKTFAALGAFGLSVITALTAQNTQTVSAIYPVTAEFVGQQLDAVLTDIGADAVKIGMLHDVAIIDVIQQKLAQYQPRYVVLDPVMVSKTGVALIAEPAIHSLKSKLFPKVSLITPNIPEAEILLGKFITSEHEMEKAAQSLAQQYKVNVLLKGGHLISEKSNDVLCEYVLNTCEWFKTERIQTKNTHGTGCTFSSAIATFLAFDNDLKTAVKKAKNYLTQAIVAGQHYQLGHGHGPVKHQFSDNQHY
jgi:hydroxymethylpyrimidine/phosphomethylpyrimidine kinase